MSPWIGSGLAHKTCALHRSRRCLRSMTKCALRQNDDQDTGVSSVFNANRFQDAFVDSTYSWASSSAKPVIPIEFVRKSEWDSWYAEQDSAVQTWIKSIRGNGWSQNAVASIPSFHPDTLGEVEKVVVPISTKTSPIWAVAAVVGSVPTGRVYKVVRLSGVSSTDIEIGWAMGNYSYNQYKTKSAANNGDADQNAEESANVDMPKLVQSSSPAEKLLVDSSVSATYMVRDIINTPAEHFGPANLEAACSALASKFGASCTAIVGDQLLRHGYPQVHTVGRAAAADRAPRLIEIFVE